ncbi:50S ribosomal protein L5 [Holospora curviuscula]|uniref:Large ribosomal subunit protein uL5 n=1 Tax=Holospora curviuscula TaxID=1082868 RepID=A0A2S5R8M7_9PROT|nr:50S ribosomal protein L5 [Holospora curviuscula]PPE03647.1 50S ribosomal protein L5 [Holospora curviuscula]
MRILYENNIKPSLIEEFSYQNVHQVPRLEKIVLNASFGRKMGDQSFSESAEFALSRISGQKPVVTHARKSNAGFKIREGMALGLKVTLRGKRMYDFLRRFVYIAMPRMRDFRGMKTRFDGKGNYSLGIKEQQIFPEINYDQVKETLGLQIVLVTSASTDVEGLALLKKFGIPFRE